METAVTSSYHTSVVGIQIMPSTFGHVNIYCILGAFSHWGHCGWNPAVIRLQPNTHSIVVRSKTVLVHTNKYHHTCYLNQTVKFTAVY